MSTHNIHFHDKIDDVPKISPYICFLSYLKNFIVTQKLPYLPYVFGQTGLSKQYRPR